MTIDIERLRRGLRRDSWLFALSAVIALAAAVAAGVGIGNLIWSRAQPPTQIIALPPGTTITTPPAH